MMTNEHIHSLEPGNDLLFSDVFDLEEIQKTQNLFSDATGVVSVIMTPDGIPVTSAGTFSGLSVMSWETGARIMVGNNHMATWFIARKTIRGDEDKVMSAVQFEKVSEMLSVYVRTLSEKANAELRLKHRIVEYENATAVLQESNEKFKLMIETMPNGFYRSTPDGHYVDVNQAMVKMLGYDSKEELLKVYIPTDIYVRPVERDEFDRSNENFVSDYEVYRLKTRDGRIIWLEDQARYVKDEHGKVIYNEGICRDITDRMRDEAEIKLQNEKLLKINAEKDKFFSIIAHDLRSPFNSFLGLTQIMAEDLPGLTMEEIQKIAESMRNSATNLFRLLENLLQWSKIQQGLIPFNREVVSLLPVIEECIEMMQDSAKIKDIEITNSVSGILKVFADSNILQTVIRNLISNAVKFTRKGGKINISADQTDDSIVKIAIKDSGIGMDESLIENLFRIDVQTNRLGTEGEPSTGLGLILCKDFIEKHGGKIWAESEKGSGSVFYFTIPGDLANKEKTVAETAVKEPDESRKGNLVILIAEDDQTSGIFLTNIVKSISKKVYKVSTGVDAIETCRNNPDIDLILMDIQMPETDGYEATRQIRQFNKKVIIIAQTAFALSGDKAKAAGAGCNDYITKPVKKDELLAMIRSFF